jgi:hypothetical protein
MILDTRLPQVVMEEITDPDILARARVQWDQFERNWSWFKARVGEISEAHRGKYICVAGQELFAADTPEEILAWAATAHPEEKGIFTRYIPREKMARIYAAPRTVGTGD